MSDLDFRSDIRSQPTSDDYVDGCLIGINRDVLDDIFSQGLNSLYTPVTRAFRGFSHFSTGAAFPANYDLHGYTFFTKPRMKLTAKNCIQDRSLIYMLNKNPLTIPRAVRAYLDPIGSGSPVGFTVPDASFTKADLHATPLVDPLNPFITLLSNSLVSLTGWPSVSMDTFTSDAGIQREQWAMYDGVVKQYQVFDLNATFSNMRGDPLGYMFYVWCLYGQLIQQNENMLPWLDSIMDREKDYETRIYRLIMDPSKTYVQKIACTGASFPTASNVGESFDYDSSKPLNAKLDTHSMSFKSQGAIYYDGIVAVSFNTTVVDFNPNMYPGLRKKNYTKIPSELKIYFPNEGYPWINTDTSELEWYVPNQRYKQIIASIK